MNRSISKDEMAATTTNDSRWASVVTHDAKADGKFFYSVKTTGVYCRPGCAARLARPENVRFHTTANDAERAGFRPCKRCKPNRRNQVFDIPSATFRAARANEEIHFAIEDFSLGSILVAKSERGVCAILMGDDPDQLARDLRDRFPRANLIGPENLIGKDRNFENLISKVVRFVETPSSSLDLPLDVRGTAFQQRVWQALRGIPAGATATYTDIAQQIGSPKSVRAVAQACGANALAVAIPCHRVVRNDGALSGYRWGVERKRALLDREAHA